MVESLRNADWSVDTTWYHVVSLKVTNQICALMALSICPSSHQDDASGKNWLASLYHVASTNQSALRIDSMMVVPGQQFPID